MESEANYRRKNFVATLGIYFTIITIGFLGVKGILRSNLFEVLLAAAVLLTWLVNRSIPFWQFLLLLAAIVVVSWVFGEASNFFPPISLITDKVINFILVAGFGAYWVRKKFISAHRNT